MTKLLTCQSLIFYVQPFGVTGVLVGLRGVPRDYVVFREIKGRSGGFRGVSGAFQGFPGGFRGVRGVFRVLQTPI